MTTDRSALAGSDPDSTDLALVLRLNGEERHCPAGLNLLEVVRHCGYEPRLVVVEFNGEILQRQHWPHQPVQTGDVLEVVTIVGGGS